MFAVLDAPLDAMTTEALVPPCADAPDQFFSEDPQELHNAKFLCRVCPLRDPCLSGALERREPWGVWGGELFERGKVVAHKRGPGRPRKDDDGVVPSPRPPIPEGVESVPAVRSEPAATVRERGWSLAGLTQAG